MTSMDLSESTDGCKNDACVLHKVSEKHEVGSHGNSHLCVENRLSNWSACARYLSTFKGLEADESVQGRLVLLKTEDSVQAHFPTDIKYLPITSIYSKDYNGDLPSLPNLLKTLELHSFTGQLPALPHGLEYLNLHHFDGKLPILPNSLKTIKLENFNQYLKNIPDNLTHLVTKQSLLGSPTDCVGVYGFDDIEKLRKKMTQKKWRDKIFAERYTDWETCVQYLKTFQGFIIGETGMVTLYASVSFPSDFDKLPITKINSPFFHQQLPRLPESLEYLDLPLLTTQNLPELPHSLKVVKLQRFNGVLPKFPDCLVSGDETKPIRSASGLQILDLHSFQGTLPPLPDSIKKIILNSFRGQLPKLPSSLQELILGVFNETLPMLPDNLRHLELPSFNGVLPEFPDGLIYLNLNSFEGILHHIPNSVQTLYLRVYNRQLPKLPDSLKLLSMELYNHTLPKLPETLQRLNLHWFNGVLPTLPDTLEYVSLPSYTMNLPNVPQKLDYLVTGNGLQSNFQELRENLEKKKETSQMYPDRYTNWSVCAGYLCHFRDIKVLDVGTIKLSRSPDFPYDFHKLPITNIHSVLYQGGLPELPQRLEKLSLTRFNNQLPRLPDTLRILNLKIFTRGLPNIPLNLKMYVNAGGKQNMKEMRLNKDVFNLQK